MVYMRWVFVLLIGTACPLGCVLPYLRYHGIDWREALGLCGFNLLIAVLGAWRYSDMYGVDENRRVEFMYLAAAFPSMLFLVLQGAVWTALSFQETQSLVPQSPAHSWSLVFGIAAFGMWVLFGQFLYRRMSLKK
jgi:hypothetical protein